MWGMLCELRHDSFTDQISIAIAVIPPQAIAIAIVKCPPLKYIFDVNVNSALMLHFNAAFTIMQQQSLNVGGDPPSPPLHILMDLSLITAMTIYVLSTYVNRFRYVEIDSVFFVWGETPLSPPFSYDVYCLCT